MVRQLQTEWMWSSGGLNSDDGNSDDGYDDDDDGCDGNWIGVPSPYRLEKGKLSTIFEFLVNLCFLMPIV